MNDLAPILLFTFTKLDTLKLTVESLQSNTLCNNSDLFIFSDAGRTDAQKESVEILRSYLKSIKGFKTVTIQEASTNKGLARSIIDGVSFVLQQYKKVIVLEDDLLTAPNFLNYMNQALEYYEINSQVHSVAGFSMPIKGVFDSDVYFTQRATSWGWATWKDRWEKVDWEVMDYQEFRRNACLQAQFNRMGSDLSGMLKRQMNGKINSWAIRWCYHQFKHNLYSVHPVLSKVVNIGLENAEATHTNEKFSRYKTILDTTEKHEFAFSNDIQLDKNVIRQFVRPYSIPERIKYKLMNTFHKLL